MILVIALPRKVIAFPERGGGWIVSLPIAGSLYS
jgi:hypothetical protein